MGAPVFIGEVKTESPFGFRSPYSWDELLAKAIVHADWIAVHTNERWGGRWDLLERAADISRDVSPRPLLLAKGPHTTDTEVYRALDAGADLVLVVGEQPSAELAPVCIWEPDRAHDLMVADRHDLKVMWNYRDLRDGSRIPEALDLGWARTQHKGWLCQASFICSPGDVHLAADAFIVGEHLPEFIEQL